MTMCKKPDRDVAALVCGYPLPCPHHTIVIEESQLEPFVIERLHWLRGAPSISIEIRPFPPSEIHIKCVGALFGEIEYRGERVTPLDAPMAHVRDASDELTREAHVALESVSKVYAAEERRCAECLDTGIVDTGNNEHPCDCPLGDAVTLNVAGRGLVSGRQLKAERPR